MQMAQWSLFWGGGRSRDEEGGNPMVLLLGIILAPLAASVLQMAISRTREFGADAGAAEITGNPRALVKALQRLEAGARQMPMEGNPAFSPLLIINPLAGAGQFLAGLFATHPATEKRVEKLLELEQEMLQTGKIQGRAGTW
jgi:heat shock protein HtpX